MKKILETERLWLRELTPGDGVHFFNLNANPNVTKFTGDAPFKDVSEARGFLVAYSEYEKHGYGRWAVIEKKSSEFLGWCGLKYHPEIGETDIGFRFFEHHWNKGFATESAKACLDYGLENLGLDSIIGRVMELNVASVKVLEKIGMDFESRMEFALHPGWLYRKRRR